MLPTNRRANKCPTNLICMNLKKKNSKNFCLIDSCYCNCVCVVPYISRKRKLWWIFWPSPHPSTPINFKPKQNATALFYNNQISGLPFVRYQVQEQVCLHAIQIPFIRKSMIYNWFTYRVPHSVDVLTM